MRHVIIPLSIGTPDKHESQMHIVRRSYQSQLIARGITPLFITTLFTLEMIEWVYSHSNGILLMGGVDINPEHYHEQKHEETTCVEHMLDDLEIALAQKALNDGKPILGICRGCQILNIARGGSLHQHVPEVYGVDHSVENYEHLGERSTEISILENTHLYTITGESSATVLCGHHQSVNNLGSGLRVSAQDPHGVIEAIETTDSNTFALGIQAHIEMQHTSFSRAIFDAFAQYVNT